MSGIEIALAILLIVVSVLLIFIVLIQKDRQSDASAINGSASSSFFDKTQGHSKDATLGKITIILGVIFTVLVIATLAVTFFI